MKIPARSVVVVSLSWWLMAVVGQPRAAEPQVASSSPKAFPFPVYERTLANGLRAYVVKYDSPGIVAYNSIVRTGSRNEVEPGRSGFAHFFEHMMFHGTPRVSRERYTEILQSIGAEWNAFTSSERTWYYIAAEKNALPTIAEIEADRFQHLHYAKPDFQKEARAVLGEYNKNASDPTEKIEEILYDNAFEKHTYKHTVMGFVTDIEDMPNEMEYSRTFFDRYYRPDNVVLLVLGDVEPEPAFAAIEKEYRGWKAGGERPAVPPEPPQDREKRVEISWPAPTLPMLYIGYHGPAFSTTNVDLPSLDVLSELLTAQRTELYTKLVIVEQKVETLDSSNSPADPHFDPGLFVVSAHLKKAEDLSYVERSITEEIARIGREGIDERTLSEVVAHLKYVPALQLATAVDTARYASRFIGITGDIESINRYFNLYNDVTPADVKRVAQKYFALENRTVVTMRSSK